MVKENYDKVVIANRIKELRKENNWTQKDLSYYSNVSIESIKLYETARRIPDKYNRTLLANALRVSIDYLLGISEFKDKWDEYSKKNSIVIERIKNEVFFLDYCEYLGCDFTNFDDEMGEEFISRINESIKLIYEEIKKGN